MIWNVDIAKQIAEYLLQIKAIKLNPANPFQWASGWNSPIYCDNRKILSYPRVRTYVRQQMVDLIKDKYAKPEVIAGVATGGIAIGALVAQDLGLPFIYIRPKAKGHGLKNSIEGEVFENNNVVVIEDLVSTGGSSLAAVQTLRENKMNVLGMISIFTYGFDIAKENFKNNKCELYALCDYDNLIEAALDKNYIKEEELASLKKWRKAPHQWKK
ncbi:MAG: orotate phosphoribosyltransferase [Vicingaceae bacterium]